MKVIFKILSQVIIGLFCIFIIIFLLINYFANKQGYVRNWQFFCKEKQYSLWPAFDNNEINFCDNRINWKCIDGLVKSNLVDSEGNLYLYFIPSDFVWNKLEEVDSRIKKVSNLKWYMYHVFRNDYSNTYYAKSSNEVIQFLKLSNDCHLSLYSSWDLDRLDSQEKIIFIDLLSKSLVKVNWISISQ